MMDVMMFVFLLIVAAIVGFLCWWAEDCRRWRKVRRMVEDCNWWCEQNCKLCEQCNANHDDPDDVWKELEEYCTNCPMMVAVDMWEERNG